VMIVLDNDRGAGISIAIPECQFAARASGYLRQRPSELKTFLAERVGFEPTERFPAHSISSAANSTTLAPLQHCRLPIANCQIGHCGELTCFGKRPVGNRQSKIGNVLAERVGFE